MTKTTQSSDSKAITTEQSSDSDKEEFKITPFRGHLTVDLGIKEFKKMVDSRIRKGRVSKTYRNRLIKDFKKRQWDMYHESFPEDNSTVPTHTHVVLDKLALV